MGYGELFKKTYDEARKYKKKSLQSALVSESKVMHASAGVQTISDEDYKNTILPYWEKYGLKPEKFWFELYGSREGVIDPAFIPADLYFNELVPYINNLSFLHAASDKCYYDQWFPSVRHPETVCRRIGGLFYNKAMHQISEKEAIRLCLDHKNELVIKPSVYSSNSQNIHIIDPSVYDEEGIMKIIDAVGANLIAQDKIVQHSELARLNPDSVNTIRVNSILSEDGVYIPSASIRVGAPGADRVSTGSGGFFAEILDDDSVCGKALIDSVEWKDTGIEGEEQLQHTLKWSRDYAGGCFNAGFKIPAMNKIRRQVEMIHPIMAHFKWLGWDWTIDEEGEPVLIEFNGAPGIIVSQMTSCRPVFGEMTERILDDYFLHRRWEKNQKQGLIFV